VSSSFPPAPGFLLARSAGVLDLFGLTHCRPAPDYKSRCAPYDSLPGPPVNASMLAQLLQTGAKRSFCWGACPSLPRIWRLGSFVCSLGCVYTDFTLARVWPVADGLHILAGDKSNTGASGKHHARPPKSWMKYELVFACRVAECMTGTISSMSISLFPAGEP